jgi:hypothetical protein
MAIAIRSNIAGQMKSPKRVTLVLEICIQHSWQRLTPLSSLQWNAKSKASAITIERRIARMCLHISKSLRDLVLCFWFCQSVHSINRTGLR